MQKKIVSLCLMFCIISYGIFADDGIRYRIIKEHDPQNTIYIIEAHPTKISAIISAQIGKPRTTSQLCAERAGDVAINSATFMMSSSQRLERLYQLLDAAGFSFYHVYPSYGLKVDGEWWSFSSDIIGCVGWDASHSLIFDTIHPDWQLHIGETILPIRSLNHLRQWEYGFYTRKIGSYIILPKKSVVLYIENNSVIDVSIKRGYVGIPQNGAVYCMPLDEGLVYIKDKKIMGKMVQLHEQYDEKTFEHVPERTFYHWQELDNVIASTPLLIKNNTIVERIKHQTSEFYTARHPRTALGVKEDGTWVLVVVDGRSNESAGMTMVELADYMIHLGCSAAINFCGGGSSTMVVKNKVVNSPSGRRNAVGNGKNCERLLMQAIVLRELKEKAA